MLKKGNVARNMFVVLDGTLEVRDGDTLLRILSPGDVLGEIAFLLEQPRSADVYAATDARILSLSEGTVRKLIESDPDVAAHLLAQRLEDALPQDPRERLTGNSARPSKPLK